MENKEKGVSKTDPLFDGHPEKSILEMTPTEKIDYLWSLVEFRLIITGKLTFTSKDK